MEFWAKKERGIWSVGFGDCVVDGHWEEGKTKAEACAKLIAYCIRKKIKIDYSSWSK